MSAQGGVCVCLGGGGGVCPGGWGVCLGMSARGVCLSRGMSVRMTDSCKNITLLIRDFFSKGEKYDGSTRVVLPILCSMPGGGVMGLEPSPLILHEFPFIIS